MWKVVGEISSGLALVAFIVAALAMFLRQRLVSREHQLLAAREEDRAAVIQSLNDSFLITSLPIDPSGLTPEQRYNLLLRQIGDRARRFYVTSIIVVIIAAAISTVSVIAVTKASSPDVSKQLKAVEKTYRFAGPFKIARSGDSMTFSLTEAVRDLDLSNGIIRIQRATFRADVTEESDDPFGFDQHLLVFSEPPSALPQMTDSTDLQKYFELLGPQGYIQARHVYQLVGRTDWGRVVHSHTPLQWVVNVPEGGNGLELKAIRDSPLSVGPDGLVVQLFLWTGWGGQHSAELRNVEIALKMSLLSKT